MPRSKRKHENQTLFRSVNERIAELADRFDASGELTHEFVCECSQMGCAERIELRLPEYSRFRDDPTAFVVVRGHEDLAHEDVLVRLPAYLIVRSRLEAPQESPAPQPV